MALFGNHKKKAARDLAAQLVAGHTTLQAIWSLAHAGVFDAIAEAPDGLDPATHAQATGLSPDVLTALLDYLAQRNLLEKSADRYRLTPAIAAMLDYESPALEQLHAHQPTLLVMERLLANLRVTSTPRKSEAAISAHTNRYAADIYPAIAAAISRASGTHVLDLHTDGGQLLTHLAAASKKIAGVGVSSDGTLVRQANDLIADKRLEKRLIAVPASPVEVALNPREAFARTGITPALWEKFDIILLPRLLSELLTADRPRAIAALRALPAAFPKAAILILEQSAGDPAAHPFAPEQDLLLRLSGAPVHTPAQWRDLLTQSNLKIKEETPLPEALTLWRCVR